MLGKHRSIIGFIDLILWADNLFQKSLRRAIPDLDRLLVDPAGTLEWQVITVGPTRRYASGIFIGLLLTLGGGVLTLGLFALLVSLLVNDPKQGPPLRRPELRVTALILLAVVLVGSFWLG